MTKTINKTTNMKTMETIKTETLLEDKLYILFGNKLPKIDKIKDVMDKCLIPYNENELIKIITK